MKDSPVGIEKESFSDKVELMANNKPTKREKQSFFVVVVVIVFTYL